MQPVQRGDEVAAVRLRYRLLLLLMFVTGYAFWVVVLIRWVHSR